MLLKDLWVLLGPASKSLWSRINILIWEAPNCSMYIFSRNFLNCVKRGPIFGNNQLARWPTSWKHQLLMEIFSFQHNYKGAHRLKTSLKIVSFQYISGAYLLKGAFSITVIYDQNSSSPRDLKILRIQICFQLHLMQNMAPLSLDICPSQLFRDQTI